MDHLYNVDTEQNIVQLPHVSSVTMRRVRFTVEGMGHKVFVEFKRKASVAAVNVRSVALDFIQETMKVLT